MGNLKGREEGATVRLPFARAWPQPTSSDSGSGDTPVWVASDHR